MFKKLVNKHWRIFVFLVLAAALVLALPLSAEAAALWYQVPRGSSTVGRSPSAVEPGGTKTYYDPPSGTYKTKSCTGLGDKWIVFNGIPETYVHAIPPGNNKLKIWATNAGNQAHITNHAGLDGVVDCVSGVCKISLCGKGGVLYWGGWTDAWSHRLEVVP